MWHFMIMTCALMGGRKSKSRLAELTYYWKFVVHCVIIGAETREYLYLFPVQAWSALILSSSFGPGALICHVYADAQKISTNMLLLTASDGIMASQEQSVEQLFGAALDRRPEDRRAFLDRACAGAPELRQRVEELLRADEQAGSFLEGPHLLADQSDSESSTVDISDGYRNPYAFQLVPTGRFEPGQVIAERFLVVRFIARGGMGEVYEVEDRFLQGVHIALKVILPQIAGDAGSSRRFEQEVLLARKVTHPNLCPIYDISRCQEPTPSFLFLTMKLLFGETLGARLQRPPAIPRDEVILIFRQMIAGLSAIHAAGIVHRDIKPNNVMLDHSGSRLCISIMDFGLARLYASETTLITRGFVAGTPGYIAPELLQGGSPSQATDIFALGVLFQKILTSKHPNAAAHGLSASPSPALDDADAPSVFIQAVKEFLSEDPKRRCDAFQRIQSTFDSGGFADTRMSEDIFSGGYRRILTRRNFVIGSAVTACAAAGGAAWKWDSFSDLVHPIPAKRFVALLNWPQNSSSQIKPMLNGVIDAIASELARAEAFDRNLYVTPDMTNKEVSTPSELNAIRDSLGANLVLATSGTTRDDRFHVFLRLLDPSSTRVLRETQISSTLDEQISLPQKAVYAAERLLDIHDYKRDRRGLGRGTQSATAFAAFQTAEAFAKQENNTGLDASIEKYREAIELDPHYALAHARLALAFLRWYAIHFDPSAIELARGNAETAVNLEPDLVDGHRALGSVHEVTGDESGALREMGRALSLDPSNPKTLIYQAQTYTTLNRWDDAERAFRRVLRERPNYWLAYQELGMNFFAQGKYPEALDSFRTASLANPKNALALSNAGTLYLLLGGFDEARDALNRSLALEPTDAAFASLAAVLRAEGKYSEAIQMAHKAVDLKPSYPPNWLELGDCYSLSPGHSSDAKSAYSRAAHEQEKQLEVDATDGAGWMHLALYRAKSGNSSSAGLLVKKAETYKAGDIDSQLTKARVLALLGDRDAALATIRHCRKMGATKSQIELTPDLEFLRKDSRYKEIES
jgi:eukaryotic-like serine/threonine-protein kinase